MKKYGLLILVTCFLPFNSAVLQAANLAGNAIVFDGLNDFVRIPDAPQLGGMSGLTIEAWFTASFIFDKEDWGNVSSDRSYGLSGSTTGASLALFTGSTGWTHLYGDFQSPASVGQWTHIAATYDSIAGVASLYYNGNLFLTTTTDAGGYPISGIVRDSSEDLILGAVLANAYLNTYGPSFSFGAMDEVRIWNYARSATQIAQNFNRLVNPTQDGLVGYWNFDEALNSQQAVDLSSYHNNGILGSSLQLDVADPVRISSTAPIIPEPCTLALLGIGGLLLRRKN
jgi:hypothetical protein